MQLYNSLQVFSELTYMIHATEYLAVFSALLVCDVTLSACSLCFWCHWSCPSCADLRYTTFCAEVCLVPVLYALVLLILLMSVLCRVSLSVLKLLKCRRQTKHPCLQDYRANEHRSYRGQYILRDVSRLVYWIILFTVNVDFELRDCLYLFSVNMDFEMGTWETACM